MQFFVPIMMEAQLGQFDPDRFAQRLLADIHRLEQPLLTLHPAVAELLTVKTFPGFHGLPFRRTDAHFESGIL